MNKIEALKKIQTKQWYKNTTTEIQSMIENLSEKWTGYLVDLANRNDVIGGLEVVTMAELLLGGFGCLTRFDVRNPEGKAFKYEYFSWNKGPMSGAKGIVFLSDPFGKINAFVYLEAEKFAAGGKMCVDLPGGFAEEIDMATAEKFLANMVRELKEEMGITSTTILSIDQLGQYSPDYGMTNNSPFLFSVVLASDLVFDGKNTDKFEVRSKVKVRPIGELKDFVATCSDGFFLATIAKMWAKGKLIF
jgi:8-oxo-dGTP pyrophosphatase MutT (NUDIX family)